MTRNLQLGPPLSLSFIASFPWRQHVTHKVHGERKRWQAVQAQRTVAHDEGPVARSIGP